MRFTNLTRQNEIGANCYHLQVDDSGYLLDCGTHPKIEGNGGLPLLDFLADQPLQAVFVSHGHLDHLGALPLVMDDRPDARVYLTHASRLIADRALHNSASVMIRQRAELNLSEYPLFTHGQVDHLLEDIETVAFARTFEVAGADVTFYEAGHVQGAAGVWIEAGGCSIFYTGDTKFSDMKITRAGKFPDKQPDTMVIECTRGSMPSQPGSDWEEETERLSAAIQATFERGGSVLIPCFALGKMQEVLKVIHDLMREGHLAEQVIYISGLGRSYNEIYDDLSGVSPRVCPGFKLENNLELIVLDSKEALTMRLGRGRLMLVSSGMMTPRTMSHTMAQRMMPDERHSIFFVGYVDPDSPAGKVKAAGRGGRADMGGEAGEMDIRCRVESFDFTSHCNRERMIDYVSHARPRRVLLVHGETASLEWFQQELREKLPESSILIPPSGETLNLGD
ncbi:MAG: MBL fold metallo-hydrolase [Verrucomicrobia bacterium]|nr:MBL fold metallo-hydrolase [Verrucomicrobiota bacterium]